MKMMNRREVGARTVLAALSIAALTGAQPAAAVNAAVPPRRLWFRYVAETGEWAPIKFEEVRAGWYVWMIDEGPGGTSEVVAADTDYDPVADAFTFCWQIDPATNQWVPPTVRNRA